MKPHEEFQPQRDLWKVCGCHHYSVSLRERQHYSNDSCREDLKSLWSHTDVDPDALTSALWPPADASHVADVTAEQKHMMSGSFVMKAPITCLRSGLYNQRFKWKIMQETEAKCVNALAASIPVNTSHSETSDVLWFPAVEEICSGGWILTERSHMIQQQHMSCTGCVTDHWTGGKTEELCRNPCSLSANKDSEHIQI